MANTTSVPVHTVEDVIPDSNDATRTTVTQISRNPLQPSYVQASPDLQGSTGTSDATQAAATTQAAAPTQALTSITVMLGIIICMLVIISGLILYVGSKINKYDTQGGYYIDSDSTL